MPIACESVPEDTPTLPLAVSPAGDAGIRAAE
jgi:hypothetical protein